MARTSLRLLPLRASTQGPRRRRPQRDMTTTESSPPSEWPGVDPDAHIRRPSRTPVRLADSDFSVRGEPQQYSPLHALIRVPTHVPRSSLLPSAAHPCLGPVPHSLGACSPTIPYWIEGRRRAAGTNARSSRRQRRLLGPARIQGPLGGEKRVMARRRRDTGAPGRTAPAEEEAQAWCPFSERNAYVSWSRRSARHQLRTRRG